MWQYLRRGPAATSAGAGAVDTGNRPAPRARSFRPSSLPLPLPLPLALPLPLPLPLLLRLRPFHLHWPTLQIVPVQSQRLTRNRKTVTTGLVCLEVSGCRGVQAGQMALQSVSRIAHLVQSCDRYERHKGDAAMRRYPAPAAVWPCPLPLPLPLPLALALAFVLG